MKHTITNSLAALLLLATGLTACSKQEAEGDRLPDGEYAVNLIATMQEQTSSRATSDNTWEGTEQIAVEINGKVKKHLAYVDGTLNLGQGISPWYWQSTTEKKSITAWYSHTYQATRPTSFTVQIDQSGDGYQQSDMIYAAQDITITHQALIFKHLPVKVVVELSHGDGVSEDEIRVAEVSIVNQTTTSGAIAEDWSVAQVTKGSTIITPNDIPIPYKATVRSATALLVPQQMQNKKFIKVTILGNNYYYTPKNATDANLTAGKQYTYAITVNKNGITVTASGATEWSGSTSEVTSKEIKPGFAPSDLKVCDYYYSDGTWSDGGYREYTDNTTVILPIMPILTDVNGKVRTVIGIVFYVGDIKGDNYGLLDGKFPNGTHGLVASLNNLKDPDDAGKQKMSWTYGGLFEFVSTWLRNATWSGGITRPAAFTSIQEESKMQGYVNTLALQEYNKTKGNENNDRVKPIYALAEFVESNPTPASSSGWYWPSVYELKWMCWGQNNREITAGRDILNNQLKKVSGTEFDSSSWNYWSSTEYLSSFRYAWLVYFYDGYKDSHDKGNYEFSVRPVLAF